jgi:hypothetical protein
MTDWPFGYGYCCCGCGQKTRVAPFTSRRKGWVKGLPQRYLANHSLRGGARPGLLEPGQRFGRLTVVRFESVDKFRRRLYVMRCDCGGETISAGISLRADEVRSCGCLARDSKSARAKVQMTTHGMSGSPTHRSWKGMVGRCTNRKSAKWRWYGGRPDSEGGPVRVCDRWRMSFENFLADMGERPEWATGGIDRIDNYRGYEPGNCRWATATQQATNKRTKGPR